MTMHKYPATGRIDYEKRLSLYVRYQIKKQNKKGSDSTDFLWFIFLENPPSMKDLI